MFLMSHLIPIQLHGVLPIVDHVEPSFREALLEDTSEYCTISIYSVQPCDCDTFGGFSISVLTIDCISKTRSICKELYRAVQKP